MRAAAYIGAVLLAAGAASAEPCFELSEHTELCPSDKIGVVPSEKYSNVFYVGPVPHPDVWRGVVIALSPRLRAGDTLEKAVNWHLSGARRSAALKLEVLERKDLKVNGREAHLHLRKLSAPGGDTSYTAAVLGLKYADSVVVVEVEEQNVEDTDLLVSWAARLSGLIREKG